jgi:hypothetical protein
LRGGHVRRKASSALRQFAETVSGRLGAVHTFMTNSGFTLRNIDDSGNDIVFVYVFASEVRQPCLLRRALMIDTTLVAVDMSKELTIKSIQ